MRNSWMQSIWWAIWFGLFLTSVVLLLVSPEYSNFIFGVFAVSKVILLALLFINRKYITRFLKTSLFKNAFSNLITIFLVLSILGILNYLAFKNNIHFDITKQKVHTLSAQSKTVLTGLESKIKMTLFARRQNWDRFLNLLNLYKFESELISIEVIDIDTNPSLVQINNIKENGTVVIEYKGSKSAAVAKDELAITNSLIKLLRNQQIIVYYTVGHGEVERTQRDQEGGSYLFNKIVTANYILRPIDLLKVQDVPNDANLLLALGPKDGFLDIEVEKLDRYLGKGGNLFITLAPELNEVKLSNLYDLIERNGIKFNNSIVLDRLSTVQGSQATIPIINIFNPEHSITKKFKGKVLMPLSASVENAQKENINYTTLIKTNNFPGSWAERSFEEVKTGRATYDEKDIKGPIELVAVAENTKTNSRLMVSASSSFIVNGYQSQSANYNFFLNILGWGLDDEGIISLNRPSLNDEMIFLSASQLTLIFYFAIACLPFLMFAISIFLYRRRLRK